MATSSFVRSLFGGVEANLRRQLGNVFEYVLGNLRFGVPTHKERAENFQMYFLSSTTPSTANTEFTIAHGLGKTPYALVPWLPLDSTLAQLVALRVTRNADAQRIYLSSPTTNAVVTMLVEFPT